MNIHIDPHSILAWLTTCPACNAQLNEGSSEQGHDKANALFHCPSCNASFSVKMRRRPIQPRATTPEIQMVEIKGCWKHFPDLPERYELIRAADGETAATVWMNGTWHTWDEHGTGGENASEPTVAAAKRVAALSAQKQGFI